MGSNDKISIEILKNLSFQNKILTENEHTLLDLNMRVLNIERYLISLEKKLIDTYKKINDTYCILFNINENIGINSIVITIFVLLQFVILFKIF